MRSGRVLCITGVSGGGKGTVVSALRARHRGVVWSVSVTTRAPRPGEVHGDHYAFVDEASFRRLVDSGGFVEWADIYGTHRSGTPKGPIEHALAAGHDVLVELDVQGAGFVKRAWPDRSVVVFLRPPDMETQRQRLIERGTTGADLERRIETARREIGTAEGFVDSIVVNDDLETTIAAVDRLFFG